jgi:hypothetical protein
MGAIANFLIRPQRKLSVQRADDRRHPTNKNYRQTVVLLVVDRLRKDGYCTIKVKF